MYSKESSFILLLFTKELVAKLRRKKHCTTYGDVLNGCNRAQIH